MAVLVFLGMSELIQFNPSVRAKRYLTALLAAFFTVKYELVVNGVLQFPNMPLAPLNHITAQALIAFQTALFFIRPFPTAPYLPLTGILALTITANRSAVYVVWWSERSSTPGVIANEHFVYRVLALFFTVLLVFYLNGTLRRAPSEKRRKRYKPLIILGLLALLTAALGTIGSQMAQMLDKNTSKWMNWWANREQESQSSAGFSSNPWFESIRHWQQNDQDAVALRVYSHVEPGYLRARTFNDVSLKKKCGWGTSQPRTTTPPQPATDFKNLPSTGKNERLFSLRSDATDCADWSATTVYPAQQLEDAIFSPLEAAVLAVRLDEVQTDRSGVAMSKKRPLEYRLFSPPNPLARNTHERNAPHVPATGKGCGSAHYRPVRIGPDQRNHSPGKNARGGTLFPHQL